MPSYFKIQPSKTELRTDTKKQPSPHIIIYMFKSTELFSQMGTVTLTVNDLLALLVFRGVKLCLSFVPTNFKIHDKLQIGHENII